MDLPQEPSPRLNLSSAVWKRALAATVERELSLLLIVLLAALQRVDPLRRA